jgi:hypothetical protein
VKPALTDVLGALSTRVFGEIAPALPAGYLQSDAMVMALLLAAAAEEQERSAEVRHADIEDLRALFRRVLPSLLGGTVKDAVARAAALEPKSFRISDLDACGDKLSAALIELHVYVEQREEPWAREIEREIWAFLRASTERRAFKSGPF